MRTLLSCLFITLVLQILPSHVAAQATAEGQLIALNGIEMQYRIVGEGEPLVLLHGWSGTSHDFDPFVEEFARQYRLILPDLRGHGGSTNPQGEFATGQLARDVFALLDHLGIARVRLVGASMGGLAALHMATLQPSRIESMILAGAGTHFPSHCRESMAATDVASYPDAWWSEMRSRHLHGDEQITAIANLLSVFAADETDVAFTPVDLAGVEARTLIVHGDRDWCFPPAMAVEMYDAIPDAQLWIVPNGGHVPITGQHAAPFTATALAFFVAR